MTYFNWLVDHTYGSIYDPENYKCLLRKMYQTKFVVDERIPEDHHRENDAQRLLIRYSYELDDAMEPIEAGGTGLLEVLMALALRGEEQFMFDELMGDRTPLWFWTMLENIGLAALDDTHWDDDEFDRLVDIFLKRKYNSDGSGGGLFTVKTQKYDMRETELWTQMCIYFDEYEGYKV